MHSEGHVKSSSERVPSTYEEIVKRVGNRNPRLEIYHFLRDRGHANLRTMKESNDIDISSPGTISNHLQTLRGEGIVDYTESDGCKLWFITKEFYNSDPERIIEEKVVIEEKEVPRHDSLEDALFHHRHLVYVILGIFLFGSTLLLYEWYYVPIGGSFENVPETLTVASSFGLMIILSVAINEVYL